MKESWKLDPVFRQEFLDACKEAATNKDAFANFKSHDRISTVIENTPEWWGVKAVTAMGWSWTSIRYFYTAYLIQKLLHPFPVERVVEIGGGYGGQCEVLMQTQKIGVYYIFDLPEVIDLQDRYLDNRFNVILWDKMTEFIWGNLLISWCAWAELTRELKQEYYDKVISKCDAIFIASNYNVEEDREILSQGFHVEQYSDELVTGVLYGKKK